MKLKIQGFMVLFVLCSGIAVKADEVVLRNGQTITGQVILFSKDQIVLETPDQGRASWPAEYVRRYKKSPMPSPALASSMVSADEDKTPPQQDAAQKAADEWQRRVSLGYNQTSGNTEASQFSGELFVNRKSASSESTARLKSSLSTSDEKMDSRKFYGMLRHAFSFGPKGKWYNFYKFEGDQDRFADIDYRLTPSGGVGYWFADKKNFKAMVEAAVGYEHTSFRSGGKDNGQAVLIPRWVVERTLWGDLTFSSDVTVYPSLQEAGDYRMHSETFLVNPLNETAAWKIGLVRDYNSNPSGDTEKTDSQLNTSIDINF